MRDGDDTFVVTDRSSAEFFRVPAPRAVRAEIDSVAT